MALQHTIGKSGQLTGIGLHTGEEATVTIYPAEENYGIRFIRKDLNDSPEIKADIDNVVDNSRGTAIGRGSTRIYTIEHLMSALAGMRIDNCRVEVDAPEIPLMDGSALPFVRFIKKVGIQKQAAQRDYLVIDKPMWLYNKDDVALSVFPADHFHITMLIDYKNPVIGAQHTTLFSLDDYEKDFAPARTFCFLSEIEKLREQGLIKGGTVMNAVVIQDIPLTEERIQYLRTLFNTNGNVFEGSNGFLNNTELHFPNELCRHKAVDLIGDLYLLGKPICGHILGARSGHAANIELAKKIREYFKKHKIEKINKAKENIITFKDILDILPHRYPFLLVDSIVSIVPGEKITAIKNVSFNENFFQGHFPDNPIMPGVLQIEAMAQAGVVMALYGKGKQENLNVLFMGIDKARFRGQVRPGDCLRMEMETLQKRRNIYRIAGKCYVKDSLVCEAELLAMVSK
ncbi:MAG: bifunctional UDP-3-O-[3-hydroxymyristoyl] N-acetylglucosamine deacetylase/3-hydroxyacyl-ACP dehydratase [Chitinispirillia bacterium]